MKNENIKLLEIRDRATCIPAFAIKMVAGTQEELSLMKQCGYGMSHPCIMLISIEAPWHSARCSDEWNEKSPRTMRVAHKYIEENFNNLKQCEVIDVEFILKEVDAPCKSCLEEKKQEHEEWLKSLDEQDDKDENNENV